MTSDQESALLQQLGASVDATRQLVTMLKAEQRALTEHDVELLEETVSEKQLVLARLKLLEETLSETFVSLGIDPKKGVLDQLEQVAHENVQLKMSVEYMRNSLKECAQLTEENAALVATGIKRVHNSLDLIRGFYEQDVASVYGPPGHVLASEFKRDIAKV